MGGKFKKKKALPAVIPTHEMTMGHIIMSQNLSVLTHKMGIRAAPATQGACGSDVRVHVGGLLAVGPFNNKVLCTPGPPVSLKFAI